MHTSHSRLRAVNLDALKSVEYLSTLWLGSGNDLSCVPCTYVHTYVLHDMMYVCEGLGDLAGQVKINLLSNVHAGTGNSSC